MSESSRPNKIKIGPLPPQTNDYSHYEESSIRWDRIALAAAIIIAVIYGIYQLISQDESATPPIEITEQQQLPTHSNNLTQEASASKTETNDAVVAESTPETSLFNNDTIQAAPEEKPSINTSESINTETDIGTLANQASAETSQAAPVRKTETFKNTQANTLAEAPSDEKMLTKTPVDSSSITIHHPGMTRVQLTSMIKDKAPTDKLGSVIAMNQDGIIKVVLFTEMTNMRGKRTHHIWYRNGNKQATIKVPVNNNLQKSSSSKFINVQMLGDWQVKVIDESNVLLAEANFHVSAYQ